MLEKSSKKTTPAKKRQPEQSADSEIANVADKKGSTQDTQTKKAKVEFSDPASPGIHLDRQAKSRFKWWQWVMLMPVWTYSAFLIAQSIVSGLLWLLVQGGIDLSGINSAVLVTVLTSIIYALSALIAILVPYKLWNKKTTRAEIGLRDFPRWQDILLAVLTFVVYIVVSGLAVVLLTNYLPIELNNNQQLPFDKGMLTEATQYWLAFITLVVVVPFAEELLFRGYLYGKIRKLSPIWVSILVTSVTFSLAHLWAPGSPLQIMVAIDTFVLSIFLCLLREYTGAIWASFLVHAIKNGIAFYVLFVNPFTIEDIKAAMMLLF